MNLNPPTSDALADWLAWLENGHPLGIDLGLERVGDVFQRFASQRLADRVVTVAGTNGKGSVVTVIEQALLQAGYRVGKYTSPHLLHFNERICLNGEPVSDAQLVAAFRRVQQCQQGTSLTYFEFTTLAAFDLFQQQPLDVAVLEVGLGGRLDAVNLVDADVAVITSIALDHESWLGNTREAIAVEKAGIFRSGQWAVCGDDDPPATLLQVADKLGLDVKRQGLDFTFSAQGEHFDWSGQGADGVTLHYRQLPQPPLPLMNVATALQALQGLPYRISETDVREALSHCTVPGRWQRLRQAPEVLLDVGHNPAAAAYLARRLADTPVPGRTWALFSALADKRLDAMVAALRETVDHWVLAPLDVPRAASLTQLRQALADASLHVEAEAGSVKAAYELLLAQAAVEDRIIVFGSFYTVANVLALQGEPSSESS